MSRNASHGTRFGGKPCVLCGQPSTRLGEHILPRWFVEDCQNEGPFTVEFGGIPCTSRGGAILTLPSLANIHVPMCATCNNRLNTNLEEKAKPVVRRFTLGPESAPWPYLSAEECGALARWFLKVCLLSKHPDAQEDAPQLDENPVVQRLSFMDVQWLDWMRVGTNPPDSFSVYANRESTDPQTPVAEEALMIFIPHVTVGTMDLHLQTWSIDLFGLLVTVVWHPGWPILHPLVATGRAFTLWPAPEPRDFADLPELPRHEFEFCVGGMSMGFQNRAEFARCAQDPLRTGDDLVGRIMRPRQ